MSTQRVAEQEFGISTNTEQITHRPPAVGHIRRFFRFGIVGGIGVLVNLGCYAFFTDVAGIYDILALNISIELSILNNFLLNERWTFRDRARGGWKTYFKRLIAFHMSSGLVGWLTQNPTLYILTRYFHLWDILAVGIGIGLGALANYIICNRLIFRRRPAEQEDLGAPTK